MFSKILKYLPYGLFILLAVCFIAVFPVWHRYDFKSIISWDAMGYYLYLPSLFIYQDLHHLGFIPDIINTYHPTNYFYQAFRMKNGDYAMAYTIGTAIMELPFFLLGHIGALLFGFKPDGFSYPYQLAIYVSGMFYAFAGLILLRKILAKFFSSNVVAVTLIILLLGTNLGFYSFFDTGMSHGYLFFLNCLLIWNTLLWYKYFKTRNIILAAITLALMTQARPTEVLAILIPMFWGVFSLNDVRERIHLIIKRWKQFLIAAICFVIVCTPQLLYWKWATGHWYFNAYGATGLHFYFKHPHLIQGLLGMRKGWLIYTPVMILSLVGIFQLRRSGNGNKALVPVLIYFPLFVYIAFSWQVWWYGGCYGQRVMIQLYPLLAFPLAAFIQFVRTRKNLRYISACFITICVLLNVLKIYQYEVGLLSPEGPNDPEFFLNYFEIKPDGSLGKELNLNESLTEKDESITVIEANSILRDKGRLFDESDSSYYRKVTQSNSYAGDFSIPAANVHYNPGDKIRMYLKVRAYDTNPYALNSGNMVISFYRSHQAIKWKSYDLNYLYKDKADYGYWKQYVCETTIPGYLKPTDKIQVFYWMTVNEVNDVKDMRVELVSHL